MNENQQQANALCWAPDSGLSGTDGKRMCLHSR